MDGGYNTTMVKYTTEVTLNNQALPVALIGTFTLSKNQTKHGMGVHAELRVINKCTLAEEAPDDIYEKAFDSCSSRLCEMVLCKSTLRNYEKTFDLNSKISECRPVCSLRRSCSIVKEFSVWSS